MNMKGNNGSGDNPSRDSWETPQDLWDELNEQYNFKFDCCASKDNTKTTVFHHDFKKQIKVSGTAWMNPPFSKARDMFEHFFKVVDKGVAIYRCDNMETKLWQEVIFEHADWMFVPKGRVQYEGIEGSSSRFPSALIGVGVPPPKNIEGVVLTL